MVDRIVYLQARGLRLSLEGDQLRVRPTKRLAPPTPQEIAAYRPDMVDAMRQERHTLVTYIRAHRDEIVVTLASGDIWEERRRIYGELARQPIETCTEQEAS